MRFAYDNSTSAENTALGEKDFKGNRRREWKARGDLRLRGRAAKAFVKKRGTLPIKVFAVPGHNIYSPAYGKPTSRTLVLHR